MSTIVEPGSYLLQNACRFECIMRVMNNFIDDDAGQYIMMRDANKSQLRVYAVPSLESQSGDQDDDDDEVQDSAPVE